MWQYRTLILNIPAAPHLPSSAPFRKVDARIYAQICNSGEVM
jgi:hypothetical protein